MAKLEIDDTVDLDKVIRDKALADVLAERHRQIGALGWSTSHDDHAEADGQLVQGAVSYAFAAVAMPNAAQYHFPWEGNAPILSEKNTPRVLLVKAAALIVAEIERLDRAEMGK